MADKRVIVIGASTAASLVIGGVTYFAAPLVHATVAHYAWMLAVPDYGIYAVE